MRRERESAALRSRARAAEPAGKGKASRKPVVTAAAIGGTRLSSKDFAEGARKRQQVFRSKHGTGRSSSNQVKRGVGSTAYRSGRQQRDFANEEIDSDEGDLEADSGGEGGPVADASDKENGIQGENEDERRLRVARTFLRELAAMQTGHVKRTAPADEEMTATDHSNGEVEEEASEWGCFVDRATEVDEDGEEEDEEEEALAVLLRRESESKSVYAHREISQKKRLSFRTFLRGHKLPVTCVAVPGMGDAAEQQQQQTGASVGQKRDRHVYTGGKDCCVVQWDLQEEKKLVFKGKRNDFYGNGHFRGVLGLCVAPDESFFCSVGDDQLLRVWDARASTHSCVTALRGHTGSIRSVKFNRWPGIAGSSLSSGTSLFNSGGAGDVEVVTCGVDKSVRLWNLTLRTCVNSFHGHTAAVSAMDVLLPNRPLTVGEDNTARSWKLHQDTHLVFTPQLTSIDSCCCLSPSLFACGTQGGVVALYSTQKKKPLASAQLISQHSSIHSTPSSNNCRAVSAMTALRRSDVFFTGAEGGGVQMWRVGGNKKESAGIVNASSGDLGDEKKKVGLHLIQQVPVRGVVSALTLTPSESFLVAAVSKESRFGRWFVDKGAKNGIALYTLADEYYA